MSDNSKFCIESEADDSIAFGSSVAINHKYLAISDPGNNCVIIYTPDPNGQWVRTRKILPPKNSVPYKLGSGFGFWQDLQLDGDVLIIYAYISKLNNEIEHPEYFKEKLERISKFYARYLIRLDSEAEVQEINWHTEEMPGFVRFNLLSEGKIKQIKLSNRGEYLFGANFAVHNNLLLVGSPSESQEGKAWLYDLNHLENEPLKIEIPNIATGLTVAVSENFVATGHYEYENYIPQDNLMPRRIVIRSLNNGSMTVLDRVGHLFLDSNILAICLYADHWYERYSTLITVFRLDDNAQPHLIIERKDVNKVWLQNGFLVFLQTRGGFYNPKVLIETIS